jgi:hypothetical protein
MSGQLSSIKILTSCLKMATKCISDILIKPHWQRLINFFTSDEHCIQFNIEAKDFFADACKAFNSMFTRIEAAGGIVREAWITNYLFIKRLGQMGPSERQIE